MINKAFIRKVLTAFLGFSVVILLVDAWQGWTMGVLDVFVRTVLATVFYFIILLLQALYLKRKKR